MGRSSRWVDVLWLLAAGIASSAWCLTAAAHVGVTFDEPFYLKSGLHHWRTGSNKPLMSAGTMTLPVDVQTLPVYVWERCRGTPFDPLADLPTILPVARAANLVFWWVLLAYAMRLGRTFGGAWGGRLAVGFVAADPNFLGHAALATTDIPLVALMLVLLYHYHHGRECGWGRRVLVPGLCYGLATLAKASGMVFGAQAMIAMGVYYLAVRGDLTPPSGSTLRGKLAHVWHGGYRLRKDLAWTAAVGFALVFAYTGSDWGTEHTFVEWAEGLPDGPAKAVMLPLSQHLKVFPNAGEGLLQQVKHNIRGHGTYFLGEWHYRATWAYFPVALTMKTPVPGLALLLAVGLLRPRGLNTPLGWAALVLFLFSFNCRVQIGIRFMFTLMAVAYVVLAAAAARSWTDGRGRPVPRVFVGGLLASMIGTAAWVWPNGVSYFNQLWGGPANGHALLHDSNLDWGQGLPELRAWHRANGEPTLVLWYYGADPAAGQPPFRYLPLHHLPVPSAEVVPVYASEGYLAVGATLLYGDPNLTPSAAVAAAYLRTQRPVARTTHFFIYDLRRK